ncbi:MAG: hypothetical protein M1837_000223 [Sclerophora amabilis]|nr:MAG: hypothetical protein M1837_000223 [Sclerophora amabilis]
MADSSVISELQQSLRSQSLALSYEKSVHALQSTFEDEDARRLRLHILLLEDANDDLHDQLSQDDDHVDALERGVEELQERVDETEVDLRCAQADVRAKARELEAAKAELKSLNGISTSSTKILTEKLAIGNELATLKPELEHLRSQASSHQSILSEKLYLERQLNTLQVELETEKRTTQRLLVKENTENEHEAKLQGQLESLRKELAKEKRERDRIEKDAKKETSDLESRRGVLEGKLEAMRDKLRTTKDRLKDSQTQFQEAQAAAAASVAASAKSSQLTTKNPKKRAAADVDAYATIGTPDGVAGNGRGRAAKRNKRSSTMPGDKSTFSMTPFLSRTSLAPESPPKGKDGDLVSEPPKPTSAATAAAEPESDDVPASPTIQEPKQPRRVPAKKETAKRAALGTAKAARGNTRGNARGAGRRAAPTLEQVAEEGNDENEPPADSQLAEAPAPVEILVKPLSKSQGTSGTVNEETEAKKKKRKLLGKGPGKTLFDEDDGEAGRLATKSLFGGARGLGVLGTRVFAGSAAGGSSSAFGSFSPLKKDRKISTAGRDTSQMV